MLDPPRTNNNLPTMFPGTIPRKESFLILGFFWREWRALLVGYADTFFITRAEDNSSDESGGFFCKDAVLDFAIFSAIITFNTALAYHRLALEVRPRQ
jgi:hypothetical protein